MRHEFKAIIDINLGGIASWTELSGAERAHILLGSNREIIGADKEMIEQKCATCSTELLRYLQQLEYLRIHILKGEKLYEEEIICN